MKQLTSIRLFSIVGLLGLMGSVYAYAGGSDQLGQFNANECCGCVSDKLVVTPPPPEPVTEPSVTPQLEGASPAEVNAP